MDTSWRFPHALDRRVLASRAVLVIGAFLSAGCSDTMRDPIEPDPLSLARNARGAAVGFSDGFDTFDYGRWSKEAHPLGRGAFLIENVTATSGTVSLILPATTYDGGEIRSVDLFRYGTYAVRLRTPIAPGSITAFFLYEGKYRSDEIDIEIFNDGSRLALLTTWVRGQITNHASVTLPFDPTSGFNDYTIEWTSSSVRFYQNGVPLREFRSKVPRNAMHVMANAWWPVWLSGDPPASDAAAVIDRIDATPR